MRPTYHRVVVYLIIVFSLRLLHAKIYYSIFLLLVIVMDSIKSNLSRLIINISNHEFSGLSACLVVINVYFRKELFV